MSAWLPLLFEACMAVLMAALIVYCAKLNRRLSVLRSQDAQISELIAGFREASDRAEASVQRLKAAGLAAERSLRRAIEDAATAMAELERLSPSQSASAADGTPGVQKAAGASPPASAQESRANRDLLMGATSTPRPPVPAVPPQTRPRTREEAEESVIQAIRSARGEA